MVLEGFAFRSLQELAGRPGRVLGGASLGDFEPLPPPPPPHTAP